MTIESIRYKDGLLELLDQRKLPLVYEYFKCKSYKDVEFAIKDMVVRGAPAIGIAAAYGAVLAVKEYEESCDFKKNVTTALNELNETRPTAVNLMWAVKKMRDILNSSDNVQEIVSRISEKADELFKDEELISKSIAENGFPLIKDKMTILTHCNTGSLATIGLGTALGVIKYAFSSGKDIFVYADETRPRLQGARLTAFELKEEGIPFKLIADSAAATLIRDGKIDLIIVGADRIASNGDTANKIGTFMLSVLAKEYNVPFYIAAPTSTIDGEMKSGAEIEIEERVAEEVTEIEGVRIAPMDIEVYNPAFDVTPFENITGIITEKKLYLNENGFNF